MFDFIKRMFGEGKIRAEIVCSDGSKGTVKVPYIGDITTLDEYDLKEKIRDQIRVEFGKVVTSVKIVGWH